MLTQLLRRASPTTYLKFWQNSEIVGGSRNNQDPSSDKTAKK